MNTNKKIIIGSLMGCIFGATVGYSASVVSLPHTFKSGTPIKASEVNENFMALAQSIENLKNANVLNKSSSFVEENYTTIDSVTNSTITQEGINYLIRQLEFQDPITGNKYIMKYPAAKDRRIALYTANCSSYRGSELIVKQINISGIKLYLSINTVLSHSSSTILSPNSITGVISGNLRLQIGNMCGVLELDNKTLLSIDDLNKNEMDKFISHATSLSQYVYVKSL